MRLPARRRAPRLALLFCLGCISATALAELNAQVESGLRESTPEAVGISSERLERLNAVVERLIDERRIPGAVTLIARRGAIAHLHSQGMLDVESGRPMRPDAIFRIYSMTKPITSTAIMILVEEGRLLLTDPVAKYVPELADLRVHVSGEGGAITTEPLERPVTIHDLLTHTAGLTYHMFPTPVQTLYRTKGILPGVAELERSSDDAEPVSSLQEMAAAVREVPLLHQPGERFSYGINTDVLGYVVEKISGRSLGDFLQQRIFDPLRMNDTALFVPSAKIERFAALYEHADDGTLMLYSTARESRYTRPPTLPSGGAGLVASAADYLRFCQMLLNGGELDGVRILGPKTVEMMTRQQLNETGGGVDFGLGFRVTPDIATTQQFGSTGTYSWGGAASTVFWIDPAEDLIVIAMTQVINPVDFRFETILRPLVYQAVIE